MKVTKDLLVHKVLLERVLKVQQVLLVLKVQMVSKVLKVRLVHKVFQVLQVLDYKVFRVFKDL